MQDQILYWYQTLKGSDTKCSVKWNHKKEENYTKDSIIILLKISDKEKNLKISKRKRIHYVQRAKKKNDIAVLFGKNANEKMEQRLNIFELIF